MESGKELVYETQFYYFASKKYEITIANNMVACY